MRGIVADANIEGQVARLVGYIRATGWAEFWDHLGLVLETFANVGLTDGAPDAEVWRTCQRERLVLITANRNDDGPDSLESTIRTENTPDSLPVLTIGNAMALRRSADYAERVVARLIEYLIDIDRHRGAGRLYLP
jgi:hypothetical protein